MRIYGIAIAAMVLLQAGSAGAQAASGNVVDGLTRCRAIAADDQRLRCFDEAAAALEAAVKAKEIRVVDRQDIRKARRSLFGFALPRIPLLGGDDEDEATQREFQELNTTLASVRRLPSERMELRLAADDGIWATTDPMPFPPKPGRKVRIRKGSLGNYFINIEGERSVRGIRVR